MITNTVLGVPYYNYSITGPTTLFYLLTPYISYLEGKRLDAGVFPTANPRIGGWHLLEGGSLS